jgi:hypothetical protein
MKCVAAVLLSFAAATFLARGQTIGAGQGVVYEVIGSTTVIKQDAGNCPDIPNKGEYRRETRHYRDYQDGHLVRDWIQEVDIFVRCFEP